jgi:protein arginine kinase
MPPFQNNDMGSAVLDSIRAAAEQIEAKQIGINEEDKLFFVRLRDLPPLDRQILLEKHLISKEHADGQANRALLLNTAGSLSIMINEEDHLRIQALVPGLQLEKAWELADKIDDLLEGELEYAFHEDKGYLTACPTNVGTGLRASVMLHLPGLALTNQAPKIFSALGQLGLAVRGLYGEGTEATGHIYQISNQITLGQKEIETIQNMSTVTGQIIEKEEETRKIIVKEMSLQIKDRVGRAYGILKNAAVLSSQEALNLLSDLRLGIDQGIIEIGIGCGELNELMVASQPGFLQKFAGAPMEALERDAARAKYFQEKLDKRG